MTEEKIINIAWNIFPISDREKNEAFIELLVHFAQGIAQKEREACAQVCEEHAVDGSEGEWDTCCEYLAKAIRARGQE